MLKNLSIGARITFGMIITLVFALIIANVSYSFFFNRTTTQIIETSSREINKQVIMNFERYISEVIQTANYLDGKTIDLTEDGLLTELEDIYIQAADMSQDVESIVLLDAAGEGRIHSGTKTLSDRLWEKSWFQAARLDPEIFHFSTPHVQDIYDISSKEVITVTKSVKFYEENQLVSGILLIDLTTTNLIGLAEKTNLGENGHILILNDVSKYVYSSLSECEDGECASKDYVDDIILGGQVVQIGEDEMYANVNTLKGTRWRIATFINIDILSKTRTQMNWILVGVFSASVLFSVGFALLLSYRISSPLNKLKEHMAKIESGDLMTEIQVSGQKEIVVLSSAFNHMIEEIRGLMDRLLTEQKEKRKSEFFALQMQINPHFLYNTLDSIIWLAESGRNEEVIEMVVALSKFFRISISRGKNVIPVMDELEHAKNYLNIQKIRYNKQFDYHFDIDPQVHDYTVVKLILQPIIENAIYHGISTDEQGYITISSFIEENSLYFTVKNNGYGITEEKIAELMHRVRQEGKAESVGLRNVYQRLKIYYGDEADLKIESEMDEYTMIVIRIPLRKVSENEKVN